MSKDLAREGYINKLKNQLYKLLCEFEEDKNWEAFLDSILLELAAAFPEEDRTIDYYTLMYKVSMVRYLRHQYFKKNIFQAISLLNHIGR